jgi:membrane protein
MAMPARAERLLKPFETLIERMVSVGVVSSGVVLAAQTFLALIPLLMAATALLPAEAAAVVQNSMRERLGISGSSDAAVSQLVNSRDQLRGGLTVLGVIVVLASATSFTRALQRVYEQAWGLPGLGLRGRVRGLMWLLGTVAYLTLLGIAVRFAGGGPTGSVLRTVLALAGAVLLWWWTPYVLLDGRVRPRALLPGAILTAAAMLMLGLVGSVYVPRSVRNNERQFGTIGVVFAIESWLVVVACVLVGAAVVSAVWAQADDRLGRLWRGTADVAGWRRAKGAITGADGADGVR